MGEGLRNFRSVSVEQTLRLILVVDPRGDLRRSSPLGLARGGAATARVAMFRLPLLIALDAAIAIDSVVTQTAEHTRTINFRSQVFHARVGMGRTTKNGGLLAAVSFVQHIGDSVLVVKWCQRRENPGGVTPGGKHRGVERGLCRLFLLV